MGKLFVLALLLFATNAHACLNIFSFDSSGRVHYLEHEFLFSTYYKQNEIEKLLKKLERKFNKGDYSYQNVSNYGVYLLMAGRSKEGLDLFRALSKKYPGLYEICANTAVAYELNGNIDSAYLWQVKAMEINPQAHNNSEWIHLKILEARKHLLSDPGWCLDNNITGAVDSINSYKEYFDQYGHENGNTRLIFREFIDQLEDRFPFTYAEDKVMGKLMFELGDAYQSVSIYRAYYCYAIAKYLYPALSGPADKKMNEIRIKYPVNSVVSNGTTIKLTGKTFSDREMLPPDEAEVSRFINKLVNRPAVKALRFKPVRLDQLIDNI